MPLPADKIPLHVVITTQAKDGWVAFAEENGVTMSGLLEAMGRALPDGPAPYPFESQAAFTDAVNGARQLDAANRRRAGRRNPQESP